MDRGAEFADGPSGWADYGWADCGWGAELESWPDPESDWAGSGFTRRNDESTT